MIIYIEYPLVDNVTTRYVMEYLDGSEWRQWVIRDTEQQIREAFGGGKVQCRIVQIKIAITRGEPENL